MDPEVHLKLIRGGCHSSSAFLGERGVSISHDGCFSHHGWDPLDTQNGTRLSIFDVPVIAKTGPPTVCSSRAHVLQPQRTRQHSTTEFLASYVKKFTELANWPALPQA